VRPSNASPTHTHLGERNHATLGNWQQGSGVANLLGYMLQARLDGNLAQRMNTHRQLSSFDWRYLNPLTTIGQK